MHESSLCSLQVHATMLSVRIAAICSAQSCIAALTVSLLLERFLPVLALRVALQQLNSTAAVAIACEMYAH
jgi:hypothetical protein